MVKPSSALSLEVVALGHHVGEEDVGTLAAELQGDRDQVLGGVLHDQPPRGGLAGERDLGDPVARRQRLARLGAEPVDDVDHARRQQIADQRHQVEHRDRRLLGGFEHHRVAGRQRGRQLPGGHQDREVPRNDLPDHAERLVEVVGDGVLVDLGQRTLLRADRPGEVAEMVDRQRDVGAQRLADRFAVVPHFGHRQRGLVLLHPVGDLVQDRRPLGRCGLAPRRSRRVGGVERLLDVGLVGPRHLAERLAGHRGRVLEVAAPRGPDPPAPDEVVVAGFIRHQRPSRTRTCENSHLRSLLARLCNTPHTTAGGHNGVHDIASPRGRRRRS